MWACLPENFVLPKTNNGDAAYNLTFTLASQSGKMEERPSM
jgi:hypothetical protein